MNAALRRRLHARTPYATARRSARRTLGCASTSSCPGRRRVPVRDPDDGGSRGARDVVFGIFLCRKPQVHVGRVITATQFSMMAPVARYFTAGHLVDGVFRRILITNEILLMRWRSTTMSETMQIHWMSLSHSQQNPSISICVACATCGEFTTTRNVRDTHGQIIRSVRPRPVGPLC